MAYPSNQPLDNTPISDPSSEVNQPLQHLAYEGQNMMQNVASAAPQVRSEAMNQVDAIENNKTAQDFARQHIALMLHANNQGGAVKKLGEQDPNTFKRNIGIGKVSAMGLPS